MLKTTVLMACLLAVLAACERPQETPVRDTAAPAPARALEEKHTISAAPEHFDRVRAEQFEKEEDRLRKRGRN
jgi:hypothetical protein